MIAQRIAMAVMSQGVAFEFLGQTYKERLTGAIDVQ